MNQNDFAPFPAPLPAILVELEYRPPGETEPADEIRSQQFREAVATMAKLLGLSLLAAGAAFLLLIATGNISGRSCTMSRVGAAKTDVATLEAALAGR